MNRNTYIGTGDYFNAYLLGKASEYLKCGDLFQYLSELTKINLLSEFEASVGNIDDWQTKKFLSVWEFRFFRVLIYSLVRNQRPEIVVETGVLHGMTSAFILEAMSLNDYGTLYSYDLPSTSIKNPANKDGYFYALPQGKKSGWLVPERLRSNWNLKICSSVEGLRKDKKELDSIDIFCHDSEHTYDTMWAELFFAWERITPGGIIICDNIEANSSFQDFCRRVNAVAITFPSPNEDVQLSPRFGIISRPL